MTRSAAIPLTEDLTIKIRHYVTAVSHGQCCILVLVWPHFGVYSRPFLIPDLVQGSGVRRSTVDSITLGFMFNRVTYMMSSPKLSEKYISLFGARGGVVAKALGYKPAGRGFDSRWYRWNFSVT